MASVSNSTRTSFASGEVSPNIRAATDLARFQTGAQKVENLVVLVEGILTRCPGTRFILELKDETQRGKMFPFRYSGSDYYVLCINGGKMRLIKDGGFLESSPGVPFELTVPWVEADLDNVRSLPSGNNVLQVAAGKAPQKLTRIAHTNWTIGQFRPKNGPVDAPNLDTTKTILTSGITGNITMLGVGGPFSAGQIDGVFRLDEASQSIVSLWKADETITLTTESVPGVTGTIGDVSSPANAFDSNNATSADKATATEAYVGSALSSASNILSARVHIKGPAPGAHGTIALQLYGKKTAGSPASDTDGDLLATLAYDVDLDGGNDHTLISSDTATGYLYFWIVATYSGAATTIQIAEVIFSRLSSTAVPVLRRWQQNVYQALTSGATGVNAPVHTVGDASSGPDGVTWRFLYPGYGFVQVTSVTDTNHAAGTVLSRLPDSLAGTPSYRWWPPAWCADAGWPKQIGAHDQRAYFARDNVYWLTKPTTVDDFEATVFDDSAIARKLLAPDGSFVQLQAMLSAGVLVQLARDQEWLTRAPGNFDALTVASIRDVPDTGEGSTPQIPAFVDRGVIFIGRSRQRLHYIQFDPLAERLVPQEISVACRHLFKAEAVKVVWQRDPHRLAWVLLADGTLACLTFMPDEKILGAHRHPRINCFVEDIVSIPTADDGRSELYLQTRRVINGATRRYYELLMPFFEPLDAASPTAEGAWFVDCGLRYQGTPTLRVTGANHLIGQTVAVLADGAQQTRKVVDGAGGIDLDTEASDVIIGLPIVWKFRDLPRDVQMYGQSSKGDPKRASHIMLDVANSAGGIMAFNDGEPEPITETGGADYGSPIPLFNGLTRLSLASATADEGVLELVGDNALPFTLLAITPLLEIEEAV